MLTSFGSSVPTRVPVKNLRALSEINVPSDLGSEIRAMLFLIFFVQFWIDSLELNSEMRMSIGFEMLTRMCCTVSC